MLIINKPRVIQIKESCRALVHFEINNKKETLWYEVNLKYKDFLSIERADAFLTGLLFLALKKGEDIKVNAPLSKKLFYTCNKYLIPLLSDLHGYKEIKIVCEELVSEPVKTQGAVGTGLSCGIDSFSTVVDHLENTSPEGYQISHFTFFNVGSHGDYGGEESRKLFFERAEVTKKFADEVNKEFIMVDSNLSEILELPFQATHTLRSISVVLLLQKLFGVYLYSSTVHLRDFKLNKKDIAYHDIFNLSMLATESIELYSSCATKTRVEKTQMVANYELSHSHLNVCVNDKDNCGMCFKCLRTLLTLEILGEITKFTSVFNLDAYKKKREDYIAYIIANKSTDPFALEIYNEMLKRNFDIPMYSRIKALALQTKKALK